MQVDAVQQRAAELALVARDLLGRAAAGPQAGAQVAARAGIHRRDQLEARRELGALRGARDGDAAGLQRLAQCLECRAGNSGNSSRNSTPWCASEISPGRGGEPPPTRATALAVWCGAQVGRCAQLIGAEAPAQAGHGRAFQRLVDGHGRQQAGEALRQHRLARAGLAHHQQAVPAGRRDLQRALGAGLALHVGQVQVARRGQRLAGWMRAQPSSVGSGSCGRIAVGHELPHHVQQVPAPYTSAPGTSAASWALSMGSTKRVATPRVRAAPGHGQCTANGPQLARQRELAGKFMARQPRHCRSGRWPPGCPARSAGRSGPNPWEGLPERG
jgi:hypothetical protein